MTPNERALIERRLNAPLAEAGPLKFFPITTA
jgi:hypothetical protein